MKKKSRKKKEIVKTKPMVIESITCSMFKTLVTNEWRFRPIGVKGEIVELDCENSSLVICWLCVVKIDGSVENDVEEYNVPIDNVKCCGIGRLDEYVPAKLPYLNNDDIPF